MFYGYIIIYGMKKYFFTVVLRFSLQVSFFKHPDTAFLTFIDDCQIVNIENVYAEHGADVHHVRRRLRNEFSVKLRMPEA